MRGCELAADTQGVSRATLLRDRSLLRAPNHRHYPDPHCCAIPALKRLCTVPVRLARHYHTITHAIKHVSLCSHTWTLAGGLQLAGMGGNLNMHFNQKCCSGFPAAVVTGTNSLVKVRNIVTEPPLGVFNFGLHWFLQHCSTIVFVV